MKPHIRLFKGIWYCGAAPMNGYVGIGYTATQAYKDWKSKQGTTEKKQGS